MVKSKMMEKQRRKSISFEYILLTFFFVGKIPFAPGTFASLFSIPLIWFAREFAPWGKIYVVDLFMLSVLFVLSIYLSSKVRKFWSERDPSQVVLDEVLGMTVALFLLPHSPLSYISAFLLFRLFDVVKIPPSNFFDKMENPIGIMLDDVIAGIYSNLLTRLLIMWYPNA